MIKTDVLVIGGGIVGAGIFRELALHQASVILIDKYDFCSQTSQGSSKMLHGGLRYLETFDFSLVEEALEEKNLWLKMAPHLTYEALFHLPVYKLSKYPLPFVELGLALYDTLSHFRNKPHSKANKQLTLSRFPELNPKGLRGAGIYHDGIVDDHKLGLECIYDGLLEKKSSAFNHHELVEVKYSREGVKSLVRDRFTNEIKEIFSRFIIFATGPFTDQLLDSLSIPWSPQLLPSKGVHLWLKKESLNLWGPLLLNLKDGRVLFVIPQREAILVGTTETPVREQFENIQASPDDIQYLLNAIKDFFPSSMVKDSDILSTTAAIRPLVRDGSGQLGKASRFHKIYQPQSQTYVILGGKYTTFRRMAQDLNKKLIPRLNLPYSSQLTLNPLRQISVSQTFNQEILSEDLMKKIILSEMPKTWDDFFHRRLSQIDQHSTSLWGKSIKEWKLFFQTTIDKKNH